MAQFIGARVSDGLKTRIDRVTRAKGISFSDYIVGTVAAQVEKDEARYADALRALAAVDESQEREQERQGA